MNYVAQYADSPAIIARKYGISLASLISANPHKPTTTVAGQTTWRSLAAGEPIIVPGNLHGVGWLGDAASDAAHALASVNPCLKANAGLVCAFQRAAGLGVEGKYGAGTRAAMIAHGVASPPAACATQSWWLPGSQCPPTTTPAASVTPAGSMSIRSATPGKGGAIRAGQPGTESQTLNDILQASGCAGCGDTSSQLSQATYLFKLNSLQDSGCTAYNCANTLGSTYNMGGAAAYAYGPGTQIALGNALGRAAPKACTDSSGNCLGGASPAPFVPPPSPGPPIPGGGSTTQQTAALAMSAALAAHGYKQVDQPLYRAFQNSSGLTADGYPGTGTMNALSSTLSSIGQPMPNVKIYPWKTGAWDGVNAPTLAEWNGAAPPVPVPTPPVPAACPPGQMPDPMNLANCIPIPLPPCPAGQARGPDGITCVPNQPAQPAACPPGQIANPIPFGPPCIPNPLNQILPCPSGTTRGPDGVTCVPSPQPNVPPTVTCPPGQTLGPNGQCMQIPALCPPGQLPNPLNPSQCIPGGQPTPCPSGMYDGSGKCLPWAPQPTMACPDGQAKNSDGSCPPAKGGVTPPAPSTGISTGAMVAGGLGAVALVGIIVLAATSGGGKKSAAPARRRAPAPKQLPAAKKKK